jgi:outer membrane protein
MDMFIMRKVNVWHLLFVPLFSILVSPAFSQSEPEVLTLERAMELALQNNIELKRAQNNIIAAVSNKRQAVMNFLPNLNASIGYTVSNGTNFDNNSGQFVTTTFEQSSPTLSSNMNLFSAFYNHHLLHRRENEVESSVYALRYSELIVRANVLLRFLNVSLDRENIKNSERRLELLQSQLEREEKRESVGVASLENVYNFRSQVANQKLTLVGLENQYKSDFLALIQTLQLNDPENYVLQDVEVQVSEEDTQVEPFQQVMAEVLENSYNVKSSFYTMQAAKNALKVSRTSYYPSVGIGAGIGTRYSTNNDGELFSQYKTFTNNYYGFQISVPIFNNFLVKNQVAQAKVGMFNAELNYKQAILDITNRIQRDYLDLVSSITSYESALENFEAQEQTFNFVQTRFDTGATDFYTYLESLNNKNNAEITLINARYSIVFRNQILDLFRGMSSNVE